MTIFIHSAKQANQLEKDFKKKNITEMLKENACFTLQRVITRQIEEHSAKVNETKDIGLKPLSSS